MKINSKIIEIPKNIKFNKGTLTQRHFKEVKNQDRETDVFYKVDKKLEKSNVSIPTLDAVIEAKDWVDNENKK